MKQMSDQNLVKLLTCKGIPQEINCYMECMLYDKNNHK